jgi:hypothetical protein
MKVIVACEFSGRVREAFRAKGHDAWSCDLLPSEILGQHIQDDVLKHLNDGWDLMIAHPPCTYLSYAATSNWNNEGRVFERLRALEFFAKLWTAPIERICIENPMGCASPTIAKYTQIIQPYYFGDTESKRTCLWLKNLPKLIYNPDNPLFGDGTEVKPKIYAYYKTGKKQGKPIYGNDYCQFSEDRWKTRSITFHGIANAMAEQWG